MKDHHPRIAVTEHSLHRGVRPKSRKAVSVIKLKPPSPWRHPRSMPDSPDPATALAPAPIAAGSPFEPSDSPTRFREDPINQRVAQRNAGLEPLRWGGLRIPSVQSRLGFLDLLFVCCSAGREHPNRQGLLVEWPQSPSERSSSVMWAYS